MILWGDKFRFPFSMIQSWEFNGMPPFCQEMRSYFAGIIEGQCRAS